MFRNRRLRKRQFVYNLTAYFGLFSPLNLGTEELISADGLVDLVCKIAGKRLHKVHALDKPQGVRGRNSDNSRLRIVLGWEPQTRLAEGLNITYHWIEQELERTGRLTPELVHA